MTHILPPLLCVFEGKAVYNKAFIVKEDKRYGYCFTIRTYNMFLYDPLRYRFR